VRVPACAAFAQALQQAGWTLGQNLRLDYRWRNDTSETVRKYAAELAALAPDVILAVSSPSVSALLQVTRTIPNVFAAVADPVGAGYVESLAQPGGNATGFSSAAPVSSNTRFLSPKCDSQQPDPRAWRSRRPLAQSKLRSNGGPKRPPRSGAPRGAFSSSAADRRPSRGNYCMARIMPAKPSDT
jgi:hypothetical protein